MRIGISWISLFSLSVLFRFSWLMANGNICEAFRTVSVVKRWLVSCGIDRSRVSCRMRHTGRRISTLSLWSWTILECPIFLCEHYFHVPSSADCVPSGLKYNLIVRTREWVWERERERGGGGEISDLYLSTTSYNLKRSLCSTSFPDDAGKCIVLYLLPIAFSSSIFLFLAFDR